MVNRVKIIVDPTREEIERKLAVAIGYLSTQPTEAFGIAVVEAMANRAVPVVPKEGGPWTDILDRTQGRYGFAYTNIKEASGYVDQILSGGIETEMISSRALERAQIYSTNIFHERFYGLIRKFIEIKKIKGN